ncbi:MAG: FAD-dependent oxidoreductase [Pseudonocardiaceae bacterium]
MTVPFHVIVAGGGIGGLCLAHGLRRAGVGVTVHEREPAGSRPRGFRLHLNPAGSRALHACLPTAQWQTLLATADPPGGITFLTEQLAELVTVDESIMYPDAIAPSEDHHAVDRAELRRVLLSGLDDVVTFGSEIVGYEHTADGRVAAEFADGRREVGDVLVGADGAGSRVRRQYLPGARLVDTGVVSIAQKLYLTDKSRARVPARLQTGMTSTLVDAPYALFTSAFIPRDPSGDPYVLAALIGYRTAFPPDVTECDHAGLRAAVDTLVAGWHPQLRQALAEATERHAHPFAASRAIPALRDAHLLTRRLAAVARGEQDLRPAIGGYETEMRDYGHDAVERAVAMKDQMTATGRMATGTARAWFRLCRAVPALRRRTFADTFAAPAHPRSWELAEQTPTPAGRAA